MLARLGRVNGQFRMVVARCSVFEPPAEPMEARRLECGIPFWPHAFVTAHCDIEALTDAWGNEYAVLGVEPANSGGMLGRAAAQQSGDLPYLAPGERRRYALEIELVEGSQLG